MVITFYQGCKLTKSYDIVYCGTYFETIEAPNLTKEIITADNIYLQNQMQFAVDMSEFTTFTKTNIFKSNYLKIVDNSNSMTRYYFVDNIDYVNGDAIVSCTIDIWATYFSDYKTDYAHINHFSNRFDYVHFIGNRFNNKTCKLPFNLYTTKEPVLDQIIGSKDYYLIYFGQLYDTNTYDTATSREAICFTETGNLGVSIEKFTTIDDIIDKFCNRLLSLQGNKIHYGTTPPYTERYLEITKCYAVPTELLTEDLTNASLFIIENDLSTCIRLEELHTESVDYKIEYQGNFANTDYKLQSVGSLTHQIELTPNSLDIPLDFDIIRTTTDLTIVMKCNNTQISIEDDFELLAPFSVMNSATLAQNKIARQIEKEKDVATTSIQFTKGILSSIFGLISTDAGMNAVNGLYTAGMAVPEGQWRERQYNAKTYSSTTMLKTTQQIALSLTRGIFKTSMNADNLSTGEYLISMIGYEVDMYTYTANSNIIKYINDNIVLDEGDTYLYYPIKLDSIISYGNMPNNAKQTIDAILQKGVIVYYSST